MARPAKRSAHVTAPADSKCALSWLWLFSSPVSVSTRPIRPVSFRPHGSQWPAADATDTAHLAILITLTTLTALTARVCARDGGCRGGVALEPGIRSRGLGGSRVLCRDLAPLKGQQQALPPQSPKPQQPLVRSQSSIMAEKNRQSAVRSVRDLQPPAPRQREQAHDTFYPWPFLNAPQVGPLFRIWHI